MEAIKTLLDKLRETVTPNSAAIRISDNGRISLLAMNDEPYDDENHSNEIQDDTPQIQLSPQQLYSHLRLDPSNPSIRVLDIDPPHPRRNPDAPLRGTLRVVHLSGLPAFTALSYTWGPYSSPIVDTIRCNGYCDIRITKNGRDALLALRKRHYAGGPVWSRTTLPLTIWIDAICINQADDAEKAGQIGLMAEVYTWARTVWVWLGKGDERTARAVRGLERAAKLRIAPVGVPWIEKGMYAARGPRPVAYYKMQLAKSMVRVFLRTYWHPVLSFLEACALGRPQKGGLLASGDIDCLLDREWLERVWTFQEIVLASNPIIVCGEETIGWAQFQQGLDCLDRMRPSFPSTGSIWGDSSRNGPASSIKLRYQLFKGWAISEDFQTGSDLTSRADESMTISDVSQRWSNLFHVWRTVSRPTSWNGRAFRSVPKLNGPEQNGNSLQNEGFANYFSVKKYEGQFNIGRLWNQVRLMILLPYVGLLTVSIAIAIWATCSFVLADGFAEVKKTYFFTSMFATFFVFSNFIPFLIYVSLTMGYPTVGTHAQSDVDAANGLVAIIRVLRDRKAQEAHDKSFATHGVLKRLGISLPQPDYKKPLGKVYHELYTELVKREPSCIALLSDVKGPALQGAPSWVPSWGSEKLHLVKDDTIYSRIEDPSRPDSLDLVKWNSETEIVVKGFFIGELSYTSQPIGREKRMDNVEPVWRGSLTAIDEWRRELVELYARQTPRCEYNSFSISLTLCPSSQSSPADWCEEDFRRWHKILTSPGYDDASRHELIELALSEREFQARRFTDYICRGFAGTASLFVSNDGFVGKGPSGIEKGDEIYLIDGVGQPMIMRKQGVSGKYRVIGPAFACHIKDLHTFEDGDRGVLDSKRWGPVTLV
ncbi:hypothetical protein NCU07840 [Neurospora crassa OR74A]|uniref:Heterokaryon incompatibility domain-containing protein n=1 Tax=Neurospora crassa (strain ATCC 24698 / 74-OR23-1A / CBS 708.71 / DSM 1257 / FGSC 987) TaxID=367110 RepID=Q7SAR8_NEUCR|nr:hypothetical protein NCU07840 [Neurospora crassa OR74A]EAA33485.1 hypothetical protein NCU07840 [Neurospora crassa OR74A]|eukprot:XP_962721.1 hypothetical protein NCU07840 [Neurospora crassa OR74A]